MMLAVVAVMDDRLVRITVGRSEENKRVLKAAATVTSAP